MRIWIFCFLCVCNCLAAADFRFKDRLVKASKGDYFVFEANKTATLLAIRSISPAKLLIEEVSLPSQKIPPSWPAWIQARAPGHTSWSMIEIDLVQGVPLDCYSFSRGAWIPVSEKENLLATLLQLSLKPIAADQRRRIGPPPLEGEKDYRKFWNPPLVREGQRIEKAEFEVFQTEWPQDGTELAGKTVSVYFDQERKFPFPFWIQIDGSAASAALRTIDCGKNLPIIYKGVQKRTN